MTKIPGQEHFQREDHNHAAHQEEAAHPRGLDPHKKGAAVGKDDAEHEGHPVEETPKGPRKGQ